MATHKLNSVFLDLTILIGTVCWMIQLLPQVWKSWREKSTKGLSHYLGIIPVLVPSVHARTDEDRPSDDDPCCVLLLWGISGAFLGVYNIVQDLNIPLIVQPQVLSFFSLLSWSQCQYYGNRRSLRMCLGMLVGTLVLLGGFEAGMVFAIRPPYHAGNHRPVQFFGIMSSILLSSALFPQYYEIYKYKEVIGISIPFMAVDLMGGVFSILSLLFKPRFDVIAGIAYGAVVLLDGIVILLALILSPLAWGRRKRAAQGQSAHNGVDPPGVPKGATRKVDIDTREKSIEDHLKKNPSCTYASDAGET